MKNRLLILVNIVLIPYVWCRFPREARDYQHRCFQTLFHGDS